MPRIKGIRISRVNSADAIPRCFYVIDIPRSNVEIHQAPDGAYYRRQNSSNYRLAHYEILELTRRSQSPKLVINVAFPTETRTKHNIVGIGFSKFFYLNWLVENLSETVCEYAIIDMMIDDRLRRDGFAQIDHRQSNIPRQFSSDGITYSTTCSHLQLGWKMHERLPIFKGVPMVFIPDGLLAFPDADDGPFAIGWRCRAPKMETSEGTITISRVDGTLITRYSDDMVDE